ncbi:uncharacterized protein LOC121800915 [Salvia splendens]|uniref:uncharacterized protein LOC121800915 n=1 Tax=Salvia splendens TaxID=180675 RepID=UPI001C26D686|nr:uncharacterized protein LOC121800915 [Salvia splendens]
MDAIGFMFVEVMRCATVLVNPLVGICSFNTFMSSSSQFGYWGSDESWSSSGREDPKSSSETSTKEAEIRDMAHVVDPDPEIGSLTAHLDGEPAQTIVMNPRQRAIDIKTNVLGILPTFSGRRNECPYAFLNEFSKLCSIQKRPKDTTEEHYRLRAIPFPLKGEANTWLLRLPSDSIRTWRDFKLDFLDYFFPSNKTNALKKEIVECKQEYDESLSQYWSRFKGLLDACPNHKMIEAEIYYLFYEGANPESKDLMNSSSGGNFTKKKGSVAREILGKLIEAKKAYDSPRNAMRRGSANALREQDDERVEARIDRLEKALLNAIENTNSTASQEKEKPPGPGEISSQQYYGPQEGDYYGSWNPGRQRDAPWRNHPNFRWSDNDPNQPPPQQNTQLTHQPERQTNWSGRNQEGQTNWNNRNLRDHSNWGNMNQTQGNSYVPPHQMNHTGNYQNSQPPYQGNQGPGPAMRKEEETPSVKGNEKKDLIPESKNSEAEGSRNRDDLQAGDLGKPLPRETKPFFLDPELEAEKELA